jgi:hypothetical protein
MDDNKKINDDALKRKLNQLKLQQNESREKLKKAMPFLKTELIRLVNAVNRWDGENNQGYIDQSYLACLKFVMNDLKQKEINEARLKAVLNLAE